MFRALSKLVLGIFLVVAFATAAPAQEKLTVMLDWFINPDHGPLFVALERGYFTERGLEVEFIEPADRNDPPKLVAAGLADVAISYQPQLHLQINEGLPIMRIGTLVATPLNSLVVLEDGPIRSIADLRGKKIGFSVGGFEEAILASLGRQARAHALRHKRPGQLSPSGRAEGFRALRSRCGRSHGTGRLSLSTFRAPIRRSVRSRSPSPGGLA